MPDGLRLPTMAPASAEAAKGPLLTRRATCRLLTAGGAASLRALSLAAAPDPVPRACGRR